MTDTVIEKREVPDWITQRVNKIGGLNQFGGPNYRVVWGGNRTHTVGAKFKKVVYVKSDEKIIGPPDVGIVTEVAEIRELLKYHPHRWHLERYREPEFYGSPEEWYEQTYDSECGFMTQGPYPSRGDYEHIFFLAMCPHMKAGEEWCGPCRLTSGVYIPLEENVKLLEIMIYAFQKSDEVSKQAEKRELFEREAKKRQMREKRVGEMVRGVMRPQMALQPTSWQDGTRCSVPEASLETLRQLPHSKLGFGQSNSAMPNKKQEEIN